MANRWYSEVHPDYHKEGKKMADTGKGNDDGRLSGKTEKADAKFKNTQNPNDSVKPLKQAGKAE